MRNRFTKSVTAPQRCSFQEQYIPYESFTPRISNPMGVHVLRVDNIVITLCNAVWIERVMIVK